MDLKPTIQYIHSLKPRNPENGYLVLNLDDPNLEEKYHRFKGENEHYKVEVVLLGGILEFNMEGLKLKGASLGVFIKKKP